MATFTMRVVDLADMGFDFGLTPDHYPIFDETYRVNLNSKIIRHYWLQEIGQETDSQFRYFLNRKMNEIMPYYNQLYLSEKIVFDPLQTMNYQDVINSTDIQNDEATTTQNTEDVKSENTSDTSSGETESNTLGKSRSVSSTTPQVQLSGNEDYASSAADVNSDSGVTGSSTSNSTGTATSNGTGSLSGSALHNGTKSGTIERVVNGSQGIASELLMIYRTTFLNIDMQIIRDLEPLFMQIWDNGDEFNANATSSMNWGL